MIKVASLFGSVNLQGDLKDIFKKNKLSFVSENCETEVQLLNLIEEHTNIDVVIIAASAVDMSNFINFTNEIHQINKFVRIVVILYGSKEQYFKSQIDEYGKMKIDLIFDNNGFDVKELIDYAKCGKLQNNMPVQKEKPRSLINQPKETHIPCINDVHYTIAVFGITHGAGVTSTVVSLATYFGLQNRNTACVDFTGTKSLEACENKKFDVINKVADISKLTEEKNISVFDFGVPYNINPKGEIIGVSNEYNLANIQRIICCDIKIGVGLLDPWHINKARFYFENEQWKSIIDNSFVFLFNDDPKILRKEYPDINMYKRDDEEFREVISNLFMEGQ